MAGEVGSHPWSPFFTRWEPNLALPSVSAAPGATRKLKLGNGICLLVGREPILTAKIVASLDYLSNGRVLLGCRRERYIGPGRGRLISCVIFSKPKPIQQPHPPVLLGAHGRKARERPTTARAGFPAVRPGELQELYRMADANDRPRPSVTILGYPTPLSPQLVPELAELGVERLVLNLATLERDATLQELDRLAAQYL